MDGQPLPELSEAGVAMNSKAGGAASIEGKAGGEDEAGARAGQTLELRTALLDACEAGDRN